MKNLRYFWAVGAATLLISFSRCNPRATEDELNDFKALAEANDDSLRNELSSLQDSISMAQNREFVQGNLNGTYEESNDPFNVSFNFNATNFFSINYDVEFESNNLGARNGDTQRILEIDAFIGRTEIAVNNFRDPANDYLRFNIDIDMDANTLVEIDYIEGQISQVLANNQVFEYGFYFENSEDVVVSITNISYNAETEVLSFDYNNDNAAQLAGTMSLIVPKELYDTYPNPQYRKN